MILQKRTLLLFLFLVCQYTFLFGQWKTKSIIIPVIEYSNQDLASVLDTAIDYGKKFYNRDTLSVYIWVSKLKIDTNILYLYIVIDSYILKSEQSINAFCKYKNLSCFVYYDTFPERLFSKTNDSQTFTYQIYKRTKRDIRKKKNIFIDFRISDPPYWKYYFKKDGYFLFEDFRGYVSD